MKSTMLTCLAVWSMAASTSANAADLLDLVDFPRSDFVLTELSFTAGESATTVSLAGYQVSSFVDVQNIGLFLNSAGPNLLGQTWDFTAAPSGSSASQFGAGPVNDLVFGGATAGSYDSFSQTIATIAGSSYTLSFLLANDTALGAGSAPSGFRVSVNDAQLVGAVPEPDSWALMILGFAAIGYAMRRRNVRTTVTFA